MDTFQPLRASELAGDLQFERKDRGHKTKKAALKKVITNMTMNNLEMINLFPEIIKLLAINDLEIKRMCCLYLETYAKARPEHALSALVILTHDTADPSPLIRALAVRTASTIRLRQFVLETISFLPVLLDDFDPYVRKTAAYAVAKAWTADHEAAEGAGLINILNRMLLDANPAVSSAAIASLNDISQQSRNLELTLDKATAMHLAQMLPDFNEWSQVFVLQNLSKYTPENQSTALNMIKLVMARLQHANTAVVLAAIRLILYLLNYVENVQDAIPGFVKKFQAPLVLLLTRPYEIQYVVLRNCILLLQSYPGLMKVNVQTFFSKFQDPSFIKTAKIEVLYLLAEPSNARDILDELRTWTVEVDTEPARRAIKTISKLAVKVPEVADNCVQVITDLLYSSSLSHVAQECALALQLILRRYPRRYTEAIPRLYDHKEAIFLNSEAKAALIWFIGDYSSEILDAPSYLIDVVNSFHEQPIEVQLVSLTAALKLFLSNPSEGVKVVPRIFEVATRRADDPDLRDRAFMYWRLLSADAMKAREIVQSEMPPVELDGSQLDEASLEELVQSLGFLSSVYLKPATQLFRVAKPQQVRPSAALAPRSEFRNLAINDDRNSQSPPATNRSGAGLDRSHSIALTRQRPAVRSALGALPTPLMEEEEDRDTPVVHGSGQFHQFDSEKLIDI